MHRLYKFEPLLIREFDEELFNNFKRIKAIEKLHFKNEALNKKLSKNHQASISSSDEHVVVINSAEDAIRKSNILKLTALEQAVKEPELSTEYADLLKKYEHELKHGIAAHSKICYSLDRTYNILAAETNKELKKSLSENTLIFGREQRPEQNKDIAENWAAAEQLDQTNAAETIRLYAIRRDVCKGQSQDKNIVKFDLWLRMQAVSNPEMAKISVIALKIETAKQVVDQDTGRAKSFYEPNNLLSSNYKFEAPVLVDKSLAETMDYREQDGCVVYSQKEPSRFAMLLVNAVESEECQKNGTVYTEKTPKTGPRDAIYDHGHKLTVEVKGSYFGNTAINDAIHLAHKRFGSVKVDVNAPLEFQLAVAKACAEFNLQFSTKHLEVQNFFEDCKVNQLTLNNNPLDENQLALNIEEARRAHAERQAKMDAERQAKMDREVDSQKHKVLRLAQPDRDWLEIDNEIRAEREAINAEINSLSKKKLADPEDREPTKSEEYYLIQQSRLGRSVTMSELDQRAKDMKAYEGKIDRTSLVTSIGKSAENISDKFDRRHREESAKLEIELKRDKRIERT